MSTQQHPRIARRRARAAASILPLAAFLLLAGCASADSAPVADSDAAATDAPSDSDTAAEDTETETEDASEPAESSDAGDDDVVIVGGELVDDTFVLVAAEQYAKGREPIPTVTFTGPLSVTFTFAATLDEATEIGNCQIAYGVLDASGVDITIVDDDSTLDCTAAVEG